MGAPISPIVQGLMNAYSVGSLIQRQALAERQVKLQEERMAQDRVMQDIGAAVQLSQVARPVVGGQIAESVDMGEGVAVPGIDQEVARAIGMIPGEVDVQRPAREFDTRSALGRQWEIMTPEERAGRDVQIEMRKQKLLAPVIAQNLAAQERAKRLGIKTADADMRAIDLQSRGVDVPNPAGTGTIRVLPEEFSGTASLTTALNPRKTEAEAQRELTQSPEFQKEIMEQVDQLAQTPSQRLRLRAGVNTALRMGNIAAVNQIISGFISSENMVDRQTDPAVLAARISTAAAQAAMGASRERVVQVEGPNGKPIYVRESDAVGMPAAQAPRAVTGKERSDLGFYLRAKDSTDTLLSTGLEDRVAKAGIGKQAALKLPNLLQGALGQKDAQAYVQAQRAFTEARLRKESGAAIPTHEYENDARTYFAQPGDPPELIDQKRQKRQKVLDSLAFASGKAYDDWYGEPYPKPSATKGQPAPTGGAIDLTKFER